MFLSGQDNNLRVFSNPKMKLTKTIELPRHFDQIATAQKGKSLVMWKRWEGYAALWNAATFRQIREFVLDTNSVDLAVLGNQNIIASTSLGGFGIHIWDLNTGAKVGTVFTPGRIYSNSADASGTYVCAVKEPQTITVREVP